VARGRIPRVEDVRAKFWQLQVPMTVMPASNGILGISDFGQRVIFPDSDAIDFFLLGYRMGSTAAPIMAPAPPDEQTQGDLFGVPPSTEDEG